MIKTIQHKDVKNLIQHLETFNDNTKEDEIEELTTIISFIINLGAGLTNQLNYYFKNETQLKLKC